MTLKTLTIALVCATAQAGYSISSMLIFVFCIHRDLLILGAAVQGYIAHCKTQLNVNNIPWAEDPTMNGETLCAHVRGGLGSRDWCCDRKAHAAAVAAHTHI